MRTGISFIVVVALIVAVIGAIVPASADAQTFATVRPGGRGGTWEFFLPIVYTESAVIQGKGGSSVDINADWGAGFGFGYNISDRFAINGLFTWAYRSYDATVVRDDGTTKRYSNYMDSSTMAVNGVYNIMDGNITPFVSAGIGITYVDTYIQEGPATGTCWWDPWWGYVCDTYAPTKTQNDMTYNAGVGVRFDANRQFSLQGGYYKMWMDISNASGTPDFDIWKIDFIFRM